jgi:hypothetical protein
MPLLPDFQFSQSNLQDYADCPRRFELRYMLRLKWPAMQSEPYLEQEKHIEQGESFHRSVHQHIIGIPEIELTRPEEENADLLRWWQNYLTFAPLDNFPGKRFPERSLSMPFEGFRFGAKYDVLIISEKDHFVIFDWKTSRIRTPSKYLKNRLQTRVYPFVLTEAGKLLNRGKSIDPGQIEMVYWFAGFPQDPETLTYDQEKHHHNFSILSNMIREIINTPEGGFVLTIEPKKCNYCNYRSLCNRGIQAGAWNEMDDSEIQENDGFISHDDLDGIPEIEF